MAFAEGADPIGVDQSRSRYMIPTMDEVGKLFECEKYFVRESLLPRRAVIGTVKSDLTGGAWVAMQFAHEVGADDHSDNASTAVALARSLTGVSPS